MKDPPPSGRNRRPQETPAAGTGAAEPALGDAVQGDRVILPLVQAHPTAFSL